MKKLFSSNYSAGAFNVALLLVRLVVGILMIHHGYSKLVGFSEMKDHFPSFLGLGSTISLALVVFAEFFCALFIVLGLFTRLSSIPLIIEMFYALSKIHNWQLFMDGHEWNGEPALLFLSAFVLLLLVGPGKVSVDSMIGK
jgi:putative oxidoreductase